MVDACIDLDLVDKVLERYEPGDSTGLIHALLDPSRRVPCDAVTKHGRNPPPGLVEKISGHTIDPPGCHWPQAAILKAETLWDSARFYLIYKFIEACSRGQFPNDAGTAWALP